MINLWKKLRNRDVRRRQEILAADREITKLREKISRLECRPLPEDFEALCVKYVHLEREMRDMERFKNLDLQRKDALRYKALSLLSKKAFKEYCASVENGTRGVDDLVPVLIRDRGGKI